MKRVGNYSYEVSPLKGKKLRVIVKGKTIDFGQLPYQHHSDATGLLKKSLSHNDEARRKRYLTRTANIRDKQGRLTKDDPSSANYHARRILWNA